MRAMSAGFASLPGGAYVFSVDDGTIVGSRTFTTETF
jgi:hypothetical protein